jgi:hypothetical protein
MLVAETTVALNADEVMCLSDRVLNHDCGTEPMCLSAFPLLLKLGSLFVELVGSGTKQGGELPIVLTEPEIWLLRGKITTGDKTASDPLFGVRLLNKLYTALLELNGADPGLPDGEHQELPLTADQKQAIGQHLEAESIREWEEKEKQNYD